MKIILSSLFMLFIIIGSVAQNNSIKGIVIDNNKQPLVGVNIIIKNTLNGTQTDINGAFEIKNVSEKQTIVVSYIGYKTKEIISTDFQENEEIILFEGNEILQEIIVETNRQNKFSRKTTAYVAKMPLKNLENSQVRTRSRGIVCPCFSCDAGC